MLYFSYPSKSQFAGLATTILILTAITTNALAEPATPVSNSGNWWQVFTVVITVIVSAFGLWIGIYKIMRDQTKDAKEDINNRFGDMNNRFNDLNSRLNSIDGKLDTLITLACKTPSF